MSTSVQTCPCSRDTPYSGCCQPLHLGKLRAQTAEQLMRSRYSAYALKIIDYLVDTTHPDKRSQSLAQSISAWAERVKFYRLEIISTQLGLVTDKIGKVEFIAHYRQEGVNHQLHELSRFRRFREHWVYLDGEINR